MYIIIEYNDWLSNIFGDVKERVLLSFDSYKELPQSVIRLKGVKQIKSRIIGRTTDSTLPIIKIEGDQWIYIDDIIDNVVINEKAIIPNFIDSTKWHDFDLAEGYFKKNKVDDLEAAELLFEVQND